MNIPFNFNHDNLDDTKIIRFVDNLHKKHITNWLHTLCNSQKLEIYNIFKNSYTPSIYVVQRIPLDKGNVDSGGASFHYAKLTGQDSVGINE